MRALQEFDYLHPNPMSAHHSVLFGFLAVESGSIAIDDLESGVQQWLRQSDQSLGDVLVDLEFISESEQSIFDQIVQFQNDLNAEDLFRSVRNNALVREAAERLALIDEPDVQEPVLALFNNNPDKDHDFPETTAYAKQRAASVSGADRQDARFDVIRKHAKGGLGEVFVARDNELNREVALKEIREAYADDPESRNRFVLEAEVTGRLEHPGIVPVYGSGRYADGRPFYAMRFVKGENYGNAIRAYHQNNDWTDSERTLKLRQLLSQFTDVCQAVGYAHSRGVIHRDIKPENIMLGKFGETLLVDWGMAKVLDELPAESQSTPDDEETLDTDRQLHHPTMAGIQKGTPEYMSPEQARGDIESIGTRSDIYSLGATLYQLLTGKPPVARQHATENIIQGKISSPRTVDSKVPVALDAVCMKAMALQPADRYRTAADLADDINRYLADEAVSATVEPASIRFGHWIRKHSIVAASAAVATIVTLVAAVTFSIVMKGTNEQLAKTNTRLSLKERELTESNTDLLATRQENAKGPIRSAISAGEWSHAIKLVEDFQREYEAIPADIRILRLSAYDGLLDNERLKQEVVDMLESDQFDHFRPQLKLWRRYVQVFDSPDQYELTDDELSQLPPADQAYALGLRSDRMADSLEQYSAALEMSSFHLRSRMELVTCLLFLGRYEECQRQVGLAKSMFPDDPRFKAIEILSHALAGKYDLAAQARKDLDPAVAEKMPELDITVELIKEVNKTIDLNMMGKATVGDWLKLSMGYQRIASNKASGTILNASSFSKPYVVESFEVFAGTMMKIGTYMVSAKEREKRIATAMRKAYAKHPDGVYRLLEGWALNNAEVDEEIKAFDEAIASDCMFGATRRQAYFWTGAQRMVKFAVQQRQAQNQKIEVPKPETSPLAIEANRNLELFMRTEGKIIPQQADILIKAFGRAQRWDLFMDSYDRLIEEGLDPLEWLNRMEAVAKQRNAPPEVTALIGFEKATLAKEASNSQE